MTEKKFYSLYLIGYNEIDHMITVESAKQLVLKSSSGSQEIIKIDLLDSLGAVLAEDILSPIPMPPFRQSAMDGYALFLNNGMKYDLVGEVKAGDSIMPELNPGEAVRIFTGAAVPDTANAVIRQEDVEGSEKTIRLMATVVAGQNIRPKGEQLNQGEIALKKGTRINTAHIGLIASLGTDVIKVNKKPSIAIVVTGNELVEAGNALEHGKIYESNGAMLKIALRNLYFEEVTVLKVADDFEQTKVALDNAIAQFDVVLVSGGISVGDYDFVGKALKDLGVEEVFYKVKQKPGKPLFFGKKKETYIFGLPGNPAASLTCFYVYVYPLLNNLLNANNKELATMSLPSLSYFEVKGIRAQFLKAKIHEEGVKFLGGQSSSMLRTFGEANALVYIPIETKMVNKGDLVTTLILPN